MFVEIPLDADEPSRRATRRCPRCQRRSLRLIETQLHDVDATRGAITTTRTFECITENCGGTAETLEVSTGETTRRYRRTGTQSRGAPSPIEVEPGPNRIVLKT